MSDGPHFRSAASLEAAADLVAFAPTAPRDTAGMRCRAIRVHVMDHRNRQVPVEARSVELHYGAFMFTQSAPGQTEARRRVVDERYGPEPIEAQILGHEARLYELGPDPGPDDIDGPSPAVVTWHDDGIHYLIASTELTLQGLVDVAMSIYT